MIFANVVPKQISTIKWGWQNTTLPCSTPGLPSQITYVSKPLGYISMPDLSPHFDWETYTIEDMKPSRNRPLGTQNFKSVFTTAARFLGYSELLTKQPCLMAIAREFAHWNECLLTRVGRFLTWYMIGDDIAGNNGLFMSPKMFRQWLLPFYKPLIEQAKCWNLKLMFHSDGDIYDILEDLVEEGFAAVSYQPIGRMEDFLDNPIGYWGMEMIPVEDQARENEETMRLQR